MESLKSICILRLSSIGDVTHIVPIINTIKKNSPKTSITWIIGSKEYELVKDISNISFIIIDKKRFIKSCKDLFKLNNGLSFDVLLHMQVSFRSNIISTLIKARRKIGFNKSLSKNMHSFFINEEIKEQDNQHVMDSFFMFLEKIGISKNVIDYDININKTDISYDNFFVANPFTSVRKFNFREWDINNYKIISEYVKEKYGIEMILVGGQSKYEREMSEKICTNNYIYNLVGKTKLQDLYRILSKAKFYLGPDSGTLHIASMLRKKVIGLYATSNPFRTGPYKNMEYIINKYPEAMKLYKNKEISSVKWGERIRNNDAMKLITIDEVKNKIDLILR